MPTSRLLSARRIQGNECFPMIRRITWRSQVRLMTCTGTITPQRILPLVQSNRSWRMHLYYVINRNNDVYVCLFNNNNRPSIVEPQNETLEPFFTSDGYQWLKLFSIRTQILQDFSTLNFLPVTTDGANIDTQPRVGGEITTVLIDNRGRWLYSAPWRHT